MIQENFGDIARQWLRECENKNSYSTITKYKQLIKKYIDPHLGNLTCQEIDMDILNDFHNELLHPEKNDVKLSAATQRIIIMIVNNVISYGYKNNLIETELYIKPGLTKKKPLVKVFSTEEQKKIEEYTIVHNDRCSLAVLLALYTGMRIGEICGLKWSDFDFSKGSIQIERSVQRLPAKSGNAKTCLLVSIPKSNASYRIIPMPEFVQNYIHNFISSSADRDGYCISFNKEEPMEPRTLQYAYKRLLNLLEIPYLNFHCLRHTFATRCVTCGWDIKTLSEVLGHADIKITMEYYFHSSFEYKKMQMMKLTRLSQN